VCRVWGGPVRGGPVQLQGVPAGGLGAAQEDSPAGAAAAATAAAAAAAASVALAAGLSAGQQSATAGVGGGMLRRLVWNVAALMDTS
jgi:hypothetical protein